VLFISFDVRLKAKNCQVTEDKSQQLAEADGSPKSQPEMDAGYDSYRSLAESNLIIFVPKNAVPPFRFQAGGWELLQASIDLDSTAKASIAEKGFFIDRANVPSSIEPIPSDRPAQPSLEVEFALVISDMIDSIKNNPKDIRQVVYDLARYKLQEQLLHASAEETEQTRRALEGAIHGVEAFSEKRVQIAPEVQSQLTRPDIVSLDRSPSYPELVPEIRLRSRIDAGRNAGALVWRYRPWPYLRRAGAMVIIFVAILGAIQQRESLLNFAHRLPKLEWKTAVEEQSTPLVSATPPAKPAELRPNDYGVYAISDDVLYDLSSLPGRVPDIRVAVSAPLTTPSRTILPSGHPRFIVFSRDLSTVVADRAEVRVIAKVTREFSPKGAGKKPDDDAWVIRNFSFPFRSSRVNDNPEMSELHSEDPDLELPPGRYGLVLKTQAYDFSVAGNAVDPRHCIERIVGMTGTFYSECKSP
jgi:hypothetical protein